MLDSNCQFIELEKVKTPLVNQFYKRVYKKGIAGKNERVFVLKHEQQIICSAKLKSIEEDVVLTGVACDPDYQHQGYASLLINKLLKTTNQPVYCFPYVHLEAFYLRLGFVFLSIEQAPEAIQVRFNRYQQHRDLLLMVYK
ncbi:GNAT family N-acetyltransferase [Psychromonas sp. Urea-02u-13]|uniref:GNAT family N-acetyltransferase n=1 Tax=Psychromonas sp. Urea-02u-13 TaxID=2058326 RepID=UPI0012FF0B53|nr:GNAT family N-acetyltransferase [Psychromonas sp. Urea-02u-13]